MLPPGLPAKCQHATVEIIFSSIHRLLLQKAKQTHSDEFCHNRFEYLSSHPSSISISVARHLLFCDLPFVRVSLSLPLPSFFFSSSRTVSLSNTHSFFKIRKLEVKPVVSSRPQIWLHPFEFLQKVVIIFLIVCYLSCFFFVFLCNCCLVVSNPCCVFVFSFMSVLLSGAASVPECTLNGSVKRV